MIIRSLLSFLLVLTISAVSAQDKPKSPARTLTGKVGEANLSIEYNAPSVRGRAIWGELVPYDQVWRTGANEATKFKVDQAIKVEGKTLEAGEYALFTIPGETSWTIIFNKDPKQWGAYKYKEDMDALRVEVKPAKSSQLQEEMTFKLDGGSVHLVWEFLHVPFTVSQ
jgi:hypothetical protein